MVFNITPSWIANFFWTQLQPLPALACSFAGQTVIVTGANIGLGREAARHFVRLGAGKVILGCRSLEKGEATKLDIEATTNTAGVVEVWSIDLGSFESVKEFCRRAERLERLDAVVLNAAVAIGQFIEQEGYESTITVNVLSTCLSALMLLPKLKQTAAKFNVTPRLTIVASDAHVFAVFRERHTECSIFEAFKSPTTNHDRYNTSKLLVVFIGREIAYQLNKQYNNSSPVILNLVNPGFCRSHLFRNIPWPLSIIANVGLAVLGRTAEMGARTLVVAAAAGKETHGKYMDSCKVYEVSRFVRSEEGGELQMRLYEELINILEAVEPGVGKNACRQG